MNTTSIFKTVTVCIAALFVASCDKDFNEIGSDIVGDDHFEIKDSIIEVTAYDQKFGPVQTNKTTTSTINVPVNSLGYYNNPLFGKTTANFVTQVELATLNPTFNPNPVIKNVELTVPYFIKSDETETDEDGNHTYVLDSIKGASKIKLSVFESTYFLRDLDPATNLTEQQKYYSNQTGMFDSNHNPLLLNDSIATSQNEQFFFDPAEVLIYKTVDGVQEIDERMTPRMRLSLNKDFFKTKIFDAQANGKLVNDNVFKDWFRGLYFKVEPAAGSPNQGTFGTLNFKQGKITITYMCDTSTTDDTRIEKTFVINLAGNTVNLLENEDNPSYATAVTTNDSGGDSRLYLKGGEGSMAVIDLFGPQDLYGWDDHDNNPDTADLYVDHANNVPDQLDEIKHKKWLVNEANLVFYIDEDAMLNGDVPKPLRIYLYDLNNHRPLIDYYTDVTTNSSNPKKAKYIHGGIIEEEKFSPDPAHPEVTDTRLRYKIRITNHIRNLISKDSTSVRLGLVVTETIGNVSNAMLKTPTTLTDRVPAAAITSPLGIILYGNNVENDPTTPEDEREKRLKLEIVYTKPD
jgi:hypothetical protein